MQKYQTRVLQRNFEPLAKIHTKASPPPQLSKVFFGKNDRVFYYLFLCSF